jgi:hypothetical protein
MTKMKRGQRSGSAKKDWRRTVGKFPGLQEVFAEAIKLREADREKVRRQPRKATRMKS